MNAHDLLTASDAANTEADRLFKACRPDEAVARLSTFLAEYRDRLPPCELLRVGANLAAFERGRGDYRRALRIHREAAALADACHATDPDRCGMFYNGLGLTWLALLGEDPEADDRAIESFTAASFYYSAAGEHRKFAFAENNLAVVHAEAGRVEQAMEHAVNALGSCPTDEVVRGQVDDTLALIALAAGDAARALDFAHASVERLRGVGQLNILIKSVQTSVRAGRAYLRELEERRIREVFDACGWSLTRAFPLLAFNSRQALELHLKRHFPRLYEERRNRSVASPDGA